MFRSWMANLFAGGRVGFSRMTSVTLRSSLLRCVDREGSRRSPSTTVCVPMSFKPTSIRFSSHRALNDSTWGLTAARRAGKALRSLGVFLKSFCRRIVSYSTDHFVLVCVAVDDIVLEQATFPNLSTLGAIWRLEQGQLQHRTLLPRFE